jgi:hypothetical protein
MLHLPTIVSAVSRIRRRRLARLEMETLRNLLFATVAIAVPHVAAAQWKAGVARVVITPSEMTWLSGYGTRTAPAAGKIHDL